MSDSYPRPPSEPIPLKRIGYRVNDFCAVTGIGRTSLYDLINAGKIRTVRIAGRRIIPAGEADRIMTEGAQ
jgi:predicted site-specific integrase-resolvase